MSGAQIGKDSVSKDIRTETTAVGQTASGNAADLEDVRAVLAGDHEHFSGIVTRYKNMIFDLVLRTALAGDDAEDLAQEVFCRVFAALTSFDQERKFHTWIYTIAVNTVRNYNRKQYRRNSLLHPVANIESLPGDRTGRQEHRQLFQNEVREGVLEILAGLKEKYRLALSLHYFHGLDVQEVGEVLGLPANTVKTHLKRARERVSALVEKNEKYATLFREACIE